MASLKSLLALLAVSTVFQGAMAQGCPNLTPRSQPALAQGYSTRLVMNGLTRPRSLLFDNLGNLLVVEQGGTGIRYVKLTDNGGTNVCVASQKQLIPNGAV